MKISPVFLTNNIYSQKRKNNFLSESSFNNFARFPDGAETAGKLNQALLNFCGGKNEPFYIAKIYGTQEPKRFNNKKQASEELNISVENICACLRGTIISNGDYILFKEEQVLDKDGNPDIEKLKKTTIEMRKNANTAVYAAQIDETDEPERYISLKEASGALNISLNCIYPHLKGETYSAHGYILIKENTLLNDDNIPDMEKLHAIINKKRKEYSRALYAVQIYDNKKIKRFKNPIQASEELKIPAYDIRCCLRGNVCRVCDYVMINERDVLGDDGKVDFNELQKLILNAQKKANTAIYAVNLNSSNEEILRYKNSVEAAKELNVCISDLSQTINGDKTKTCGYAFFREKDFIGVNGDIDTEKLKIAALDARKNANTAIWVKKIKSEEEPVRFASQYEAAQEMKMLPASINSCLREEQYSHKDYVFVREKSAIDKNGNVDKEILSELIAEAEKEALKGRLRKYYHLLNKNI